MNDYQYLLVLGLCLIGTLPLELVIGARVWRRPRRLLMALAPPFAAFLVWDLWATATDQWSFDPAKTTSIHLPFGVPIEEALFFLVIPICALLTLEAVRTLLGRYR